MSKKKKKKKPDRDRYSKAEKCERSKKECIFVLIAFICLAIFWMYTKLSAIVALKIYSPFYFCGYKFDADAMHLLFIALFFLIIYFSGTYLLRKIKTKKKKYILRSLSIVFICIVTSIILQFNMWSFNKDSFSYNTLFQKDKIVYSYEEVEKAEIEIYHYRLTRYLGTYRITYILYMNDGNKIKFVANSGYYTDDTKLIEFDKSIADKRKVTGEFLPITGSNELNEYYSSLYNNK